MDENKILQRLTRLEIAVQRCLLAIGGVEESCRDAALTVVPCAQCGDDIEQLEKVCDDPSCPCGLYQA